MISSKESIPTVIEKKNENTGVSIMSAKVGTEKSNGRDSPSSIRFRETNSTFGQFTRKYDAPAHDSLGFRIDQDQNKQTKYFEKESVYENDFNFSK